MIMIETESTSNCLNIDFIEGYTETNVIQGNPIRFSRIISTEDIQAIEDGIDVDEALDSLKEPGSISIEDLKKKLGL
jgi:hypothetical protein